MAKVKKATTRVVEAIDKKYEIALVLKPDFLESALNKKLKIFEGLIEGNGGKIILKDEWGKRDLAYKIKLYNQGIYVLYNVSLPTTFIKELDETLRIDTEILRYLMINIDDNYKYTKFDEEEAVEEKEVPTSKTVKPVVSKPAPVSTPTPAPAPKKEEKKEESSSAEATQDKKEVKKEEASELDKKLDKLLSDDII